jgi:uncharacterized membrane protein YiaA/DNA-directed RNA polymerase subunit M/transcription elongation factor TFIIS
VPKSLQCPRCNGSVSIADNAAGKRVKCPHCEQNFLAPGIVADSSSEEDEDDWLTLSDSPVPAHPSSPSSDSQASKTTTSPLSSKNRNTQPENETPLPDDDDSFFSESSLPPIQIPAASTSSSPGAGNDLSQSNASTLGPDISAAEEELLSQFTDTSIPTADAKPPVKKNALDAIRALGASASNIGDDSATNTAAAPRAASVEYESEFRVTCKVCGTITYAKAVDSGKTTKCSDCYSEILIPKPPRIRKKPEIDIANAETFSLGQNNSEESKTADPFRKSAADLLAEASRQEEDASPPVYEDTPNVLEWVNNVFGIFKDPGVIMHWVCLSVAAAIPTALLVSIEQESLQLLLTIGMMIGGLILGGITVSCAFAILLSVANGNDQVEDWPSTDVFQWLDQLTLVLGATGLVAIPMWTICFLTNSTGLLGVALVMFSIYLLLPFILLSMLDMGSVFAPFSPELARSVSKCQEEWGGFYFSSGLLFGLLFLFTAMIWYLPGSLGIVATTTLCIFTTFAYFGMMGRLAYTIGQSVNAPPKKNDIDRSRPTDPQ